jgi:hypothetical protein
MESYKKIQFVVMWPKKQEKYYNEDNYGRLTGIIVEWVQVYSVKTLWYFFVFNESKKHFLTEIIQQN